MKSPLSIFLSVVLVAAALLPNLSCTDDGTLLDSDNNSPAVAIVGLAASSTHYVGDTISFVATVTDAEDGDLADSAIVWYSSKDGKFGTGKSCQIDSLTINTHLIVLTATDSEGAMGIDSATVIVRANTAPVASITSPADNAISNSGDTITFTATSTDAEDGALTGSSLVWTSDNDGQIGTGVSFQTVSLSVNTHVIVLAATDARGAVAYDTVTAVIVPANTAPVATITSPTDNATSDFGDMITFTASATDTEDGVLTGNSLVWTSDKDGQIGTGASFQTVSLSVNTHVIVLAATDSEGAVGYDTVTVVIGGNSAPVVTITSPTDDATYNSGDTMTFTASATDAEDGVLTGSSLVWTSDKDGQIGTGASFQTVSLSVNTHVIVLAATDSEGAVGSDAVTVVIGGNSAPVAIITSPGDSSTFNSSDIISFIGTATDTEDGTLSGNSLVWTSDRDGQFGRGETKQTSDLSIGEHVVILTSTDSDGNTGVDSVHTTIVGNLPLSVTITWPMTNTTFNNGDLVLFVGNAYNINIGELHGDDLVWTSSIDGQFGTGNRIEAAVLSAGEHLIILRASNANGYFGADSINLTKRSNNFPEAYLTSPANDAAFNSGDTVTFIGDGFDYEDSVLTGSSLVWTSSIDGQIGTGDTVVTTSLSVGAHTVTLTATDSEGLTDTSSISLRIHPSGVPIATIIYPIDEQSHLEIDTIACVGTGLDTEDGALTGGALVWATNLGGLLGVGDSLEITNLQIGYHYITLTVTDSDGLIGIDTVHLNIRANVYPEAVFASPADSSTFNEGDSVTFIGSATDLQDGTLSGGSLVWSSNIDGQLGTGDTLITTDLNIGTHTISLTATDNSGLTDVETIVLFMDPPAGANTSIGITSPASGTSFNVGDTITFSGFATDLEDGTLPDTCLVWTSDIDGSIGFGGVLETDQLSSTTHTITLTATDSDLNTTDTTITIDINPTFARVISSSTYKYGASIKPTSDGGFVIGGRGRDIGGYFDFALVKIDSAGRFVWGSNLGSTDHDLAASAIETSDGGYILTGYTRGYGAVGDDVLLIKTDQNGDLVWEKTFGGALQDHGKSVIETSDGGYLVTGFTYSSGAGNDDMYLIKTDVSGNLVWEKTFGNTSYDRGHSVIEVSTGGYLITGYSIPLDGSGNYDFKLWKTDVSGVILWESNTSIGDTIFSDGAFETIEASDGGFMIVGNSYANAGGFGSDLKLVKTDSTGEMVWIKYYGGSSYEYGYSLVESPDGGYVITGWTESYGAGEDDAYLLKTDATGNLLWEKTFGGFRWDHGRSICAMPDGGYLVVGDSDSYGIGMGWPGMYLIRTDANGDVD
jgi:K+/H+ antiporter YhaU regulatory subunit KhtT